MKDIKELKLKHPEILCLEFNKEESHSHLSFDESLFIIEIINNTFMEHNLSLLKKNEKYLIVLTCKNVPQSFIRDLKRLICNFIYDFVSFRIKEKEDILTIVNLLESTIFKKILEKQVGAKDE